MGGPGEKITSFVDGTDASVHYAQKRSSYTHDMNNKITSSVHNAAKVVVFLDIADVLAG